MVEDSDQGAGAAMESSPGRAVVPVAAAAAAGAGAQGMTFSGALTVAGVLLIFAAVALALVFIQYSYFDPRDDDSGRGAAAAAVARRTARGVDPEVLRSLPVTVYRAAKDDMEEGGVECAVCLAGLEDGEEARFLPRCGHGFHAQCVDLWLTSHSTCPLCRLTVVKPDSPAAPPLAALPPVPPEPANYAVSLPASVLLGVSDDQGALTAVPLAAGRAGPSPAATITVEIPESSAVATPRDLAAKSPGSARLRSIRRLLSFGRQVPSGSTPSASCSCGGDEGADLEQGISITVSIRATQAPPLPPEGAAGATT